MEQKKPPPGVAEVWITRQEYEDWDVAMSSYWEVVEMDYTMERIKIRRKKLDEPGV